MKMSIKEKEFEKLITKKFNVFNSLFLNLPFQKISNTGMLIPLLQHVAGQGLNEGKDPVKILDDFFRRHTDLISENDRIDFMFRVIQYVERQVVLYDSVEDAAFPQLLKYDDYLSLKEYINVVKNRKDDDELLAKLSSFSVRIVLTAHPTQFYPPSVLDILDKLKSLIIKSDINEIDITLQQLGMTSLINSKKPTPLDEAKNIIYFLRNVYYDAVIELYAGIKKNIQNWNFDNPDIVQFGFWPGGDRDGNPYVTSTVTMAVADELRTNLMKCYYGDVKSLERKLTFKAVESIIAGLKERLYASMFDYGKTLKSDDILSPLLQIRELVIKNYNGLYIRDIENLIDKVKIFKTHFASLDIRQNHAVHKQVVEEILKKEKRISQTIEELEREELISILLNEDFRVNAGDYDDELVSDTIRTISQLAHIQQKNGEEGCNRYIISNSEDIFSVLFVYGLLRWCCWPTGRLPMDVIPLFESMTAMENAERVMDELFGMAKYRNHIRQRNNTQTIMLGFSDGTKDGGFLRANWSIFKTKETLSVLCNRHDVRVIFFDGRGGPPARGGGKTHRFYASQSDLIANNALQLTIQGQTISSMYGTKDQFIHNCEQLLTAGLFHGFLREKNVIPGKSREILERLAQISFEKYDALKNHEMFIPYLENKSTLKYYNEAKIGSRPAKRGNKAGLEFKDLRAIPFVGSWSQLKQNVPGYFGIGTAIKTLVQEGRLEELKQLFKEVRFFKALILNSMMSLSKCYFELTMYMSGDKKYGKFWNILYDEYKLSREMVLLISGYEHLMEEEPISRSSIDIRERIVLPLLIIQQYALQKIEHDSPLRTSYEKIVKRSLYGNINASRNSV